MPKYPLGALELADLQQGDRACKRGVIHLGAVREAHLRLDAVALEDGAEQLSCSRRRQFRKPLQRLSTVVAQGALLDELHVGIGSLARLLEPGEAAGPPVGGAPADALRVLIRPFGDQALEVLNRLLVALVLVGPPGKKKQPVGPHVAVGMLIDQRQQPPAHPLVVLHVGGCQGSLKQAVVGQAVLGCDLGQGVIVGEGGRVIV